MSEIANRPVASTCWRCFLISCDGSDSAHSNFYENPPSKTRLRGGQNRETGFWCECCLGRLWKELKHSTQEWLQLLASTPNQLVEVSNVSSDNQKATLDICWVVKRLGIGVSLPDLKIQPALSTPNWKWGVPYSFDEMSKPWKLYLLPTNGAELINAFE